MQVLHVHDVDYPATGGGAIVMHRLHVGLRKAGVESKILCRRKKLCGSESTLIPSVGRFLGRLESPLRRVALRLGLNDVHCLNTFKITELPVYAESDLLHLHCIHGNFFNYLALPRLTASKTAVFTLHDTWPYTGHCSFNYDCERWKTGCGRCPYPGNYPPIRRDSSALEWKLKKWAYDRAKIVIVTLSTFQTERIRHSILSRFPVHQIPNGVDLDVYRPRDREECRSLLGIAKGKRVLMFAATALNMRNKGGDLLLRALQLLPEKLRRELILLMLGEGGDALAEQAGIETLNLGYIFHDRLKVMAYSAADLFVQPSRAESLPLVVQESMACGTPIAAFPVGGTVDLVRPGMTGYLAKVEDSHDLARGIEQLLAEDAARESMSRRCREVAVAEYSLDVQVQRHVDLYDTLI